MDIADPFGLWTTAAAPAGDGLLVVATLGRNFEEPGCLSLFGDCNRVEVHGLVARYDGAGRIAARRDPVADGGSQLLGVAARSDGTFLAVGRGVGDTWDGFALPDQFVMVLDAELRVTSVARITRIPMDLFPLGEGAIGTADDGTLLFVTEDGTVRELVPDAKGVAVSVGNDGVAHAIVHRFAASGALDEPEQRLLTIDDQGEITADEVLTLPPATFASALAVVGDELLVGLLDDEGLMLMLRAADGETRWSARAARGGGFDLRLLALGEGHALVLTGGAPIDLGGCTEVGVTAFGIALADGAREFAHCAVRSPEELLDLQSVRLGDGRVVVSTTL